VSPRIIALVIAATILAAFPMAANTSEPDTDNIWGRICSVSDDAAVSPARWAAEHAAPVAKCYPQPTGYESLPSVGNGNDTSVSFAIGYDPDTQRLCYVATGLQAPPVLRVGVGHTLTVQIANTLHDTGKLHDKNCPIDSYGGEGLCSPKPVFEEEPGPDGSFYPIMANEAHTADGTSNLHVHGLFVSPLPCSDEVLSSTIVPANWGAPLPPFPPCQSAPNNLTYTYQLPANHPAGAYWYHTHRHGQAEHETQMGLAGPIVVEDEGDAWRQSIGVSDEVLLVTDIPNPACLIGPNCDGRVGPVTLSTGENRRQDDAGAARAAARAAFQANKNVPADPGKNNTLDPRIDQVDQAGECAYGAMGPDGGVELWVLLLNGAPVPEAQNGFPPNNELLTKSMQPGQRQVFRLINASANSFLAPELVLNHNGTLTTLPLEIFARDGVGMADAQGNRIFNYLDVTKQQLIVPPSGRVEFVVHAPEPGDEIYVQSAQVAPGCGGNAYPARRLLLLTSSGASVSGGTSDDSDLLQNTPSLEPYLSTLGDRGFVNRTFVLSEYGRGFTYPLTDWRHKVPNQGQYDPSQTDFYITQVASNDPHFDPAQTALKPFTGHNLAPQVVVHLHGKQSVTEEWLVQNSTLEIHAFHMHQIHFRVIGDSDRQSPDLGNLLDVVNVPAAPLIGDVQTGGPGTPGFVKLRMTFTTADIGEFVFHCHILEHEDNGMMGKIKVVVD
jgi:FtsP/CotA-like multicopper oxidase with cupredoxin domain